MCCALAGRPLAQAVAAEEPEATWEISHLGGHRFAPTMLVLPHGYLYGRLTPQMALDALSATRQGRLSIPSCRGRSTWPRPGQAAEVALRKRLGDDIIDAVTIHCIETIAPNCWAVTACHTDGRRWSVLVEQTTPESSRKDGCQQQPSTPVQTHARSIQQLSPLS
ncbi:sucrase ferredoxin [Streptomyces sp. NPDC057909]|uniref:sucrase ferredoxin n=1 Tax=Streptomyces sp. NPDC057909 TaxID=3346277 RepID=UPI0036E45839